MNKLADISIFESIQTAGGSQSIFNIEQYPKPLTPLSRKQRILRSAAVSTKLPLNTALESVKYAGKEALPSWKRGAVDLALGIGGGGLMATAGGVAGTLGALGKLWSRAGKGNEKTQKRAKLYTNLGRIGIGAGTVGMAYGASSGLANILRGGIRGAIGAIRGAGHGIKKTIKEMQTDPSTLYRERRENVEYKLSQKLAPLYDAYIKKVVPLYGPKEIMISDPLTALFKDKRFASYAKGRDPQTDSYIALRKDFLSGLMDESQFNQMVVRIGRGQRYRPNEYR